MPTTSSKNADRNDGRLVLVVGPSGVGKDTLLDGARAALKDEASVVFARREITRPAEAGGENHIPVEMGTFRDRAATGRYLLSWEANGHGYGLPGSLRDDLDAGRTVVANGSRAVLAEARALFPNLRVISITASPETVAARLAKRGREGPDEIAARVARGRAYAVTGPDVITVNNDGPPEDGVAGLTEAILHQGADDAEVHGH